MNINVCFIADDGYILPTSVAITSICQNSSDEYSYNINIMTPSGISYVSKRNLIDAGHGYKNVNINVVECDVSELQLLHKNNDNRYLAATTTALLKFKIAEIFKDMDKILYLDGDIIVRDNLVDLYNTELGDNYVAAVRDLPQVLYDKQSIGGDISGRDYFNSGVMLLNLKKMRENNICETLIETKKNYNDFSLMDQNIFNIVFKDKVHQLSVEYNCCYINLIESKGRYDIGKINSFYNKKYESAYDILPEIKIMHFSSKLKPWYFYDVPLADEWMKYYMLSPFRKQPLQRIYHTERNIDMKAAKEQVNKLSSVSYSKKVIPVVFATDTNYAPYTAAAIESIYRCSNSGFFYDVNVLIDSNLTNNAKRKLKMISYPNLKVTLWNVENCFNGIDLYSVGHYSKQMYYRWLIPEIFSKYPKIIYLDCDVIVNRDISLLYDTAIGENCIGAVNNFLRSNLENHVKNRLKLELKEYCNSGVLIINTHKFIMEDKKNKCIELLGSYDKLPCPDQDVINAACRNSIFMLDDRWNFQWHHQFGDAVSGSFMLNYKERYNKLLSGEPWIIHYTSSVKPWSHPDRTYSELFWINCRNTFFYEEVLCRLTGKNLSVKNNTEKEKLTYEIQQIRKSFTFRLARKINRSFGVFDENAKYSVSELRAYIDNVRNATTFKVALMITWLPRKLRRKK